MRFSIFNFDFLIQKFPEKSCQMQTFMPSGRITTFSWFKLEFFWRISWPWHYFSPCDFPVKDFLNDLNFFNLLTSDKDVFASLESYLELGSNSFHFSSETFYSNSRFESPRAFIFRIIPKTKTKL